MPSGKFTYQFQLKWTNAAGVLIFGILVPTFFIPLDLGSNEHLYSILVATVTSFIIWEGSKLIQALVLYLYPWEKSIVQHLVYEITSIFFFSSASLIIGILTYGWIVSYDYITVGVVLQNIFVSFLIALLFIAINEGTFLFSKWKQSLIEQEKLRQENLIAKVENLKKQLDPHFLFNSLSVLSGLVHKDPNLADKFITRLSQVYRYVIEHNDEQIVPLSMELQFVEAYCFLLNVRFFNKIHFKAESIPGTKSVLPMSIQLLVENAVKHNKITETQPLHMRVYLENDFIWVENGINERPAKAESTGIGLKNLEARYKIVTGSSVQIVQDKAYFRVGLPIIQN